MNTLEFKIRIAAGRKKVWDIMFAPATYKEWVNAGWPGAYYEGNWKQGENIRFLSPAGGGTLAKLIELRPDEFIRAEHIAVINGDGTEDRESEIAKGWIGTVESYTFTENKGTTELKVQIDTTPEWEPMFNEGWPGALAKLKELCEA